MSKVCFYFQLHQPYRLSTEVSVFDVGTDRLEYFEGASTKTGETNEWIFNKVADKSYIPMLSVLLEMIHEVPEFCFSMSTSGVFLEQAQQYNPRVIELLQELMKTGRVELLAETYHHSLAALYSPQEFRQQVLLHREFVKHLFDYEPVIFRNTELIYSNDIAHLVYEAGFKGMLTEAVDRYLGDRAKTRVYWSHTDNQIPLLLKHAELSDDVAFRFSDKNWHHHPLSVEKYLHWCEVYNENDYINLFMDFETFGEHQWADTGIFDFFRSFVREFVKKDWNAFVTPRQVLEPLYNMRHPKPVRVDMSLENMDSYRPETTFQTVTPEPIRPEHWEIYSVTEPISWADVDRDLTAWRDSPLQVDTLNQIYDLEDTVLRTKNDRLIEEWRKLQTSDHFYYMCTKWAADGDVHAYFSPYESPYEAYRMYSIALAHLKEALM